jgi:RNA polymerase sigma-70 factor (ECF subfamily)
MQSSSISVELERVSVLTKRAKNGDQKAFIEIIDRYQKSVFYLAYSFFRNREDAQDIVQDTFFKVYRKLNYHENGRNLKKWIMRIARNLCIDRYRKNQRKVETTLNSEDVEEILNRREKVAERNKDSDILKIVSKCLSQLPERQRMIFVMKHYNEFKYTDIADTLCIAVGTVKSLHSRAVYKMRKMMNPFLGRQ